MSEIDENKAQIIRDIEAYDDYITVNLWYPRSSSIKAIEVGLMDVRASDGLRLEYDFERDGWIIKQQVSIPTDGGGFNLGEWQEVAFIQSWGLRDE
jgi:hypothetical protein